MSDALDLWDHLSSDDVQARLKNLQLPFNSFGYDRFGISRKHLATFYSLLEPFYKHYFKVRVTGIKHVEAATRGMLIGNHSGGIPVDAGMIFASLFFELDPPKHAHGMVEKFAQNLPFLSSIFSRLGQLSGLPEHAHQILNEDRLLLVFPEGVRGTGKLYKDKYQLERFGTGFMRISLQTQSPIIPFAFIGGEEAMPVIYHAKILAQLLKVPYFPVPKHIIPFPKPEYCEIVYGEAMHFDGHGRESDDVIQEYVDQVKERIAELISQGRALRKERIQTIDAQKLEQKAGNMERIRKASQILRKTNPLNTVNHTSNSSIQTADPVSLGEVKS